MYYCGQGVNRDIAEAKNYWEKASSLGHLIAKQKLSFLLLAGSAGFLKVFRGLSLWLSLPFEAFLVHLSDPNSVRIRYR
jgi:TPR repeat protein